MIRNLKRFSYLSLSIFILLLPVCTLALDSPDYVGLAKTRLMEMDETDTGKTWFFTITSHTDEELVVARNNPGEQDRELVSVNGEPPTAERLEKFEKQQAARREDSEGESSRTRFSEMVDFSTLALTEVTNGQAILSFTPVLDGLEKESDKLKGTLRMNADSHLIEELSLVNTEKISPFFSVSLKTFNMRFLFSPVDGETLLSRMETSIEGKAGFLKKFNESTEIVFSDYQRIAASQVQLGTSE